MATTKIITSVSLAPEEKRALIEMAKAEGKTITGLIATMIRLRAKSKGVSLAPVQGIK